MAKENKYKLAIEFFKWHKYKEAFSLFKEIAIDKTNSNSTRADAYNMMGILGAYCDPILAPDDESGLEFYKAALTLDRNHRDALTNIIASFGESFPDHQDTEAFLSAYNKLMLCKSELTRKELETLQEKHKLMQSMLKTKSSPDSYADKACHSAEE